MATDTKVSALKKVYKKLTGNEATGQTMVEVIKQFENVELSPEPIIINISEMYDIPSTETNLSESAVLALKKIYENESAYRRNGFPNILVRSGNNFFNIIKIDYGGDVDILFRYCIGGASSSIYAWIKYYSSDNRATIKADN